MSMQNTTVVEKQNNIYAYAASLIEDQRISSSVDHLVEDYNTTNSRTSHGE